MGRLRPSSRKGSDGRGAGAPPAPPGTAATGWCWSADERSWRQTTLLLGRGEVVLADAADPARSRTVALAAVRAVDEVDESTDGTSVFEVTTATDEVLRVVVDPFFVELLVVRLEEALAEERGAEDVDVPVRSAVVTGASVGEDEGGDPTRLGDDEVFDPADPFRGLPSLDTGTGADDGPTAAGNADADVAADGDAQDLPDDDVPPDDVPPDDVPPDDADDEFGVLAAIGPDGARRHRRRRGVLLGGAVVAVAAVAVAAVVLRPGSSDDGDPEAFCAAAEEVSRSARLVDAEGKVGEPALGVPEYLRSLRGAVEDLGRSAPEDLRPPLRSLVTPDPADTVDDVEQQAAPVAEAVRSACDVDVTAGDLALAGLVAG